MRRALNFLKGNVSISENVADASRSIMALFGEFSLGVSDAPFCDIMRLLGMCYHSEVM